MYEIPASVQVIPQSFDALDGYPLGGTLFAPPPGHRLDRAVVFNCGGGIRASRYRHFAAWLAERGISVLTYDYRGIGASRPSDLRKLKAGVEDWSEYDVGGAIAHLRKLAPDAEIIGISHSIGALLFGGAPNAGTIRRFVFISPHTGYVRDYAMRYRLLMRFMWHNVMPVMSRFFGYFPGKMLGLGEDIPKSVAMQWSRRTRPDLLAGLPELDPRVAAVLRACESVKGQISAIAPSDDAFATSAGIERLLDLFKCSRKNVLIVEPRDINLRAIGHFGMFNVEATLKVWPILYRYVTAAPS